MYCMLSLLIRSGFPQKVCQLQTESTVFAGHHLNSQRLNDDMRLNMSLLVRFCRGPERTHFINNDMFHNLNIFTTTLSLQS